MLHCFRIYLRKTMNPYYNLPPQQRAMQRLVDLFNADERLWKKLEPKAFTEHGAIMAANVLQSPRP